MAAATGIAVMHWAAGPCVAAGDVLTSRYDDARTGANLHETLLRPSNVNSRDFGRLFSYDVGGGSAPGETVEVYAQPLYVSNVGLPGKGVVNVVLLATTNNFVLALDADGPKPGSNGVLWKRSLGKPPSMDDVWQNCGLSSPCLDRGANIRGNVGIMSTPVIDRVRGIVFLVARVLQSPGNIAYRLHALDLRNGADRAGSPVEIQGQSQGVAFTPGIQNQRTGLALARGQVIVSWGSHADLLRYHGWVMSYRYDEGVGFTQTGVFVTTPDGSLSATCAVGSFPQAANNCAHGGIWMAGRAPAVDTNGDVLLMVGNGKNDMSPSVKRNFGNSLVRLDSRSLAVIDFFTPANHLFINAADLDFGGSGPMIIPRSDFVVGGGKEGVMHVWRLSGLGKFAAGDPSVVQKFPAGPVTRHVDTGNDMPGGAVIGGITISDHSGHIMGGPVYWTRPPDAGGGRLFNWSENAELRAYAVDPAAAQPITLPAVAIGPDFQAGHPGGILTLSANGADAGSGIVWAATYDASGTFALGLGLTGALNQVRPGTLRAYSASDLSPLWNSDQADADRLGNFAKFNPPTVANGRVYMATFSNRLVVYGIKHHKYTRPAATIAPRLNLLLDEED